MQVLPNRQMATMQIFFSHYHRFIEKISYVCTRVHLLQRDGCLTKVYFTLILDRIKQVLCMVRKANVGGAIFPELFVMMRVTACASINNERLQDSEYCLWFLNGNLVGRSPGRS